MIKHSLEAFKNDLILLEARLAVTREKRVIKYCPKCMDSEVYGCCSVCNR